MASLVVDTPEQVFCEYKLQLFIDVEEKNTEDTILKNKYIEQTFMYNEIIRESQFPDSGFDLYAPEKVETTNDVVKVNFQVKCAMRKYNYQTGLYMPCGFYLYPRSSISKHDFALLIL